MASLKEENYNALNNWVNNGGTLLITKFLTIRNFKALI